MNDNGKQKIPNRDDWSKHWSSFANTATLNPAQNLRHSLLLEWIRNNSTENDRVIDIGSGQGDFLDKLYTSGIPVEAIGFELSQSGVEISKLKIKNYQFFQVDILEPNETSKSFVGTADICVCSDVIEHVDSEREFCAQICEYLKPGGTALITVPGGPITEFDKHIGHRTHYNKNTLRLLLASSGLNVVEIKSVGFPFFNLYRLVVLLRGKKIISDASQEGSSKSSSVAAFLVMKIFRFLFRFNLDSEFGWQIFCIAQKPKE